MSEGKKRIPKLRFPEFHGNWEEKKGKELFQNRRDKGNEALPIYSVTMDRGLVPRNSLDRKMDDAEAGDNLGVKSGDIVYNMMRMWQGAFGLAMHDCMVSPAYVALVPSEGVNTDFFVQMFARNRSLYLFTSYSYGLTSDRLRLYFKDFAAIKFHIPSPPEQKKIADFLSALDAKINQLTRKKELLKAYKKGVMQKIFSQKLRFKDAKGKGFPKWEEKKGKDLFQNRREKGNETLPIYSVTLNRGLVPRKSLDRKMDDLAEPGDNLGVKTGDIVYNMMRMWQGAFGLAMQDCMVSPAYVALAPNKEVNTDFFVQMFSRNRSLYLFTSYSYGLTNDRLRLYFKDFAAIKFHIPSLPEQQKIADFLSALDAKIEKVAAQIEKNREFKKGLLQQMFV